jgi:hypothetical protein
MDRLVITLTSMPALWSAAYRLSPATAGCADSPSIDCVICLRPTTIRSLYAQMVGRGTRIYPGKENLLLLDFLWLSREHNLVRPAFLIAKDETHQAEIEVNWWEYKEISEKQGGILQRNGVRRSWSPLIQS